MQQYTRVLKCHMDSNIQILHYFERATDALYKSSKMFDIDSNIQILHYFEGAADALEQMLTNYQLPIYQYSFYLPDLWYTMQRHNPHK